LREVQNLNDGDVEMKTPRRQKGSGRSETGEQMGRPSTVVGLRHESGGSAISEGKEHRRVVTLT